MTPVTNATIEYNTNILLKKLNDIELLIKNLSKTVDDIEEIVSEEDPTEA